jgi:GNAT superfamily N-acetyltransferase
VPVRDRSSLTDSLAVRPATPDRFDDIAPVIDRSCWCQWWRMSASEYERQPADASRAGWELRREALRRQCADDIAPGLIAYLDDLPVGWCGFGPRSVMRRLVRSRVIPRIDDRPVWSIVCFSTRPGYRRRGIATALLRGVIEYAREKGAAGLEAYATDPVGNRRNNASSYMGFTSMFEAAGFGRVAMTDSRADGLPRWLLRLDLGPG